MAGKKKTEEENVEQAFQPAEGQEAGPEVPTGPPPTDYVILVNNTKMPLSCPLRSGRHVNLGPRLPGRSINRSEPILKAERTDILFLWEKKGWLTFEQINPGGNA